MKLRPRPAAVKIRRVAAPRYETLGARIRQAREAAGHSVRGLARTIGVSASLLSQVENGLAQPSVGTLWALVDALGFSLDGLFAPRRGHARRSCSARTGGRRSSSAGGVLWERLSASPDPDADFAFVTYPPGADSGADDPPSSHRGKEYGFVISGRLRIEVGDETLELGPGDSVVFGSDTPHRFRALGDEPVKQSG